MNRLLLCLSLLLIISTTTLFIGCDEDCNPVTITSTVYDTIVDTIFIQTVTESFEDILVELPAYNLSDNHALTSFKNIEWDNDSIAGGWGWGVYNGSNSNPSSGSYYVINRHGKNFLGFTFGEEVNFTGASFAKATPNVSISPSLPEAHAASSIRFHYYDQLSNLLDSSEWFTIGLTSSFFSVNVKCFRVVVEHDIDNPTTAAFDITDAEWFSMDDVSYHR